MRLAEKVDFLKRPEAYTDHVARVEAIETHMSWVFLTEHYAFKLKKPVHYSYLDFRTLDARHRDCLEEVRLNRRLAGPVYIGVVPLTRSDGRLRLAGAGRAVEWLVHMARLPREGMLDHLIAQKRVSAEGMAALGRLLADFYSGLAPIEMAPDEYRRRFADDIDENRRELLDPLFGLPPDLIARVSDTQAAFLMRRAELFDARVDAGRIVEGHGDLRPEHICFHPNPAVIDCLEFKREFRLLDSVDELAFLSMECERLGAPEAGERVLASYGAITGDIPPPPLWNFYKSFRAALRAKIAVWHNRDHGIDDPRKWVRRALDYLRLAEWHASRLP